jgi:SAM-dependent methyltransferase
MKSETRLNRAIRRWGFVDAADPASTRELDRLHAELGDYYASTARDAGYWEQAEAANRIWQPDTHPFHRHLAGLIAADSTVVDFGCGTAHAVRNLNPDIRYTGIEGSTAQVAANRTTYPQHRFINGNMLEDHGLTGQADWALSFFAIEHCVRPDLLLRRMVDTCKPGGRVAVLCPNFATRMNSLRSGTSGLTKREKLRGLRFLDLAKAVVDEKYVWPKRVETIHRSTMTFPVYLRPRCFEAAYSSDFDAVYLTSERKMTGFLSTLGCEVDPITQAAPNTALREAIIYLIARKN